jgi:hypothetical protein
VEGESDCHTLWLHDIPALGLPGASSWKETWATYLEGFETVYVVIEPDQGGETVKRWLSASPLHGRARLVGLGARKDPSSLYLADSAHFLQHWREAINAAVAA